MTPVSGLTAVSLLALAATTEATTVPAKRRTARRARPTRPLIGEGRKLLRRERAGALRVQIAESPLFFGEEALVVGVPFLGYDGEDGILGGSGRHLALLWSSYSATYEMAGEFGLWSLLWIYA